MLTRSRSRLEEESLFQNRFPAELWTKVVACLCSQRDQKSVALVCRKFLEISRAVLWHTPEFKGSRVSIPGCISIANLKVLAAVKPPLQHVSFSQFQFQYIQLGEGGDPESMAENQWFGNIVPGQVETFVKVLLKINVRSISFDDDTHGTLKNLTRAQLNCLCRLPITCMHTRNFSKDIFPALARAKRTPTIILDGSLQFKLTANDWRNLSKFDVKRVSLHFPAPADAIAKMDRHISDHLDPQPEFIIGDRTVFSGSVIQENLRAIKRTQISKLFLASLDVNKFCSLTVYLDILTANSQRPTVIMSPMCGMMRIDITLDEMRRLLDQYAVPCMCTPQLVMQPAGAMDDFAQLILDRHALQPFERVIVSEQDFQSRHLGWFRAAGMAPEVWCLDAPSSESNYSSLSWNMMDVQDDVAMSDQDFSDDDEGDVLIM